MMGARADFSSGPEANATPWPTLPGPPDELASGSDQILEARQAGVAGGGESDGGSHDGTSEGPREGGGLEGRGRRDVATGADQIVELVPEVQKDFHAHERLRTSLSGRCAEAHRRAALECRLSYDPNHPRGRSSHLEGHELAGVRRAA